MQIYYVAILYMLEKSPFDSHIQTLPLKLIKEFLYIASFGHPVSFIHKSLFDKYGLYDDKLVIVNDLKMACFFGK